jgi:TetR/AcrR family transcriptional regulator
MNQSHPAPVEAEAVQRILQAAEKLFSEQGFKAASMSAIAASAGVSKANIYHHFKSKNDLYLAVLRQVCAEMCGLLEHIVTQKNDAPQALRQFSQAHLRMMLERDEFTRLVLRELLEDGEQRGEDMAQQGFSQAFSRIVNLIREGQGQGALRADLDPAIAALMVIAADVFFFIGRDVFRHYPEVDFADDPERYSQLVTALLLQGMSAPKGRE